VRRAHALRRAGERWNAVDATLSLPAGWARRAGSRPKTTKEVLYTDTYVRHAHRPAASRAV
jgi:hypothetical protein